MFKALLRPDKALDGLLKARHPVRGAGLSVVAVGLLYSLSSAVLALAGAVPTAPVLFGLDVNNYYFWQMAFGVPWALSTWLLGAGIFRLFGGRREGGPGFAAAAALTGFIWSSLLVVAWVPNGIYAVFTALGMGQAEWVGILSRPGIWQTAYLAFYAGAAMLALRDFILAARIVRKGSWLGAVPAGVAAAAVAVGAYVAFIR
jgi:hypothetical protein